MMSNQSTNHPEFGPLLASRRKGLAWPLLSAVFFALAVAFAVAAWPDRSHGRASLSWPQYFGLLGTVDSVLLLLAWALWREWRERVGFFERGVTHSRGNTLLREIAYADVEHLQFAIDKIYVKSAYIGSRVTLKVWARGNRPLKVEYDYNEELQRKGFWWWGSRKFVAQDTLDDVKLRIAEEIANGLLMSLGQGDHVPWCGNTITPEGLVPGDGPRRGQLVAFDDIRNTLVQGDELSICLDREEPPIIKLSLSEKDFWPGFITFHQVRNAIREHKQEPQASGSKHETHTAA